MENLFAALANRDRVRIVLWLLDAGPKRQIEIGHRLSLERGTPVNPGEVSALLKPLLSEGILTRERARGPLAICSPRQLGVLLRAAAALSLTLAESGHQTATEDAAWAERTLKHHDSPAPEEVD